MPNNNSKRIRGYKKQQLRKRLFSQQPLCVQCLKYGKVTVATERDHILPLFKGGTESTDNTQALCSVCHRIKTMVEQGWRVKQSQPDGLDW